MEQEYVCSITPTEFEEYCLKILKGYAEEEHLKEFTIKHDEKICASDGTYQIDVYAEFTAMGSKFKVICECKQYKKSVDREKVVVLHKKVESIGAHKGILLSTSGFQSGAIQYARVHGIALIRMGEQKAEFYSHSNGKQECDVDDPFLYGERHMPPYFAIDCTFESDEPRRVYPTGTMIKKIYKEMNQLIKKKKGIDIDIPELEESAE